MNVVIIDTGCANLASVKWSIKHLGYEAKISCDSNILIQADKLIIPGVGTAQVAMQHLNQNNLIKLIKEFTKPILGICLGMQLLGMNSAENQGILTLGIINEPVFFMNAHGLSLPHMGWNKIIKSANTPLFYNIPDNSYFYFAHSYAMPLNTTTTAYCSYGQKFTAALQKNNFYGVQFHPERSGKLGIQLLKNFLET
ncbi:imidazole glycerol phosphate synthase subunit HisH [Candidatus Ishikawella capsulata]|uniref:Imidazole glycerol phosphate synthase subunit HisH n=1 Tax=Candidatus Ishikawaella capsulata Mpkobe TaxID=476281 RepID=C5WDB1_9ENTR|nr:imidazole glycerol phosphate synthase subunit HisH [Candidatus Ishikawaella capsulata]BAH83317.1 imidazole glycerol phosphate synthase subunit HisH [Candidatus Ishikawaella capsulata Mpkobe]